MQIPFISFAYTNSLLRAEILQAFEQFYDAENYILGNAVQDFEKKYAALNHTNYCIGVGNGLDALFICLKAVDIGTEDEVIVPANTFIATVLAISHAGATPIFVEPHEQTYTLNSERIEEKITSKTKAILPVHLYGQACEMEKIMALANKYKLYVIEDNAQAHLATYKGKMTGSFGAINGTSFYPTKNLGALGDAGAITTDSENLAHKAKLLRNYGSEKRYHNELVGYNSRLDEVQATLLNVKLKYLAAWTKQRQQLATIYNQELAGVGDLILPTIAEDCSHVFHLYVVRTEKRDALQAYLNQCGIGMLIHYPIPPHLQKAYRSLNYLKGSLPIAEKLADTSLSLPLYVGLEENQISYIVERVKAFF
ncbi:MAG: DegT/DnrJ/EryC1/StrS family aminotransferase [Cytophagales bacterium]|nr:MAG: DegT/DnrJ/EryC1/StrS family aminotransferase [Cytophagales bacterium]